MGAQQSINPALAPSTGFLVVSESTPFFNGITKTPYMATRHVTLRISHTDLPAQAARAQANEAIVKQLVTDIQVLRKTLTRPEYQQLIAENFNTDSYFARLVANRVALDKASKAEEWISEQAFEHDIDPDFVQQMRDRIAQQKEEDVQNFLSLFARAVQNFQSIHAQHVQYSAMLDAEASDEKDNAFSRGTSAVNNFAEKVLAYPSCTEFRSQDDVVRLLGELTASNTLLTTVCSALTTLQRECIPKCGAVKDVGPQSLKVRKGRVYRPENLQSTPYLTRLERQEKACTRRQGEAPLARGLRALLAEYPKPPVSACHVTLHGAVPPMRTDVNGDIIVDAFTIPTSMVVVHLRIATRTVTMVRALSTTRVTLREFGNKKRSKKIHTWPNREIGAQIRAIVKQAPNVESMTTELLQTIRAQIEEQRRRQMFEPRDLLHRNAIEFLANSGIVEPKYYFPGDSVPNKIFVSEEAKERGLYKIEYYFPGSAPSIPLRFPEDALICLRDFVEFAHQQGVRYLVIYDGSCYEFSDAAFLDIEQPENPPRIDPVAGRLAADALQQARLLGGRR